jgi:hypothetical protein
MFYERQIITDHCKLYVSISYNHYQYGGRTNLWGENVLSQLNVESKIYVRKLVFEQYTTFIKFPLVNSKQQHGDRTNIFIYIQVRQMRLMKHWS